MNSPKPFRVPNEGNFVFPEIQDSANKFSLFENHVPDSAAEISDSLKRQ